MPRPLVAQLRELATGNFLDRAANVLCFSLQGVGKTHAAAALGHVGCSVLFVPTFQLVQELLVAKRDLSLPRARRLDVFDLLILDDIGYVQQSPDEIEVLFTLMAERFERRSMLIMRRLRSSHAGSCEVGFAGGAPIERLHRCGVDRSDWVGGARLLCRGFQIRL